MTIVRVEDNALSTYCAEDYGFKSDYIWSEGNYSCDCNRELFFARGRGEPEPANENLRCTDGRFLVLVVAEDGSVVFDDTGGLVPQTFDQSMPVGVTTTTRLRS